MKELKRKGVWIVRIADRQVNTFRLKSEAVAYSLIVDGVVTGKEKRITDKY